MYISPCKLTVTYLDQSLVQIYLDSLLDFSQSICNSLKKNIENKTIPEDCYHRMKLRKPINSTTLEANRILLESKGVTKYNNFSIKYSNIANTVKLVILVITRWSDKSKRKSIRNILASFRKGKNKYHKKYSYTLIHLSYIQKIESEAQLLFVFGIPKSAKFVDVVNIIQENIEFQDMIIPGKFYIFT